MKINSLRPLRPPFAPVARNCPATKGPGHFPQGMVTDIAPRSSSRRARLVFAASPREPLPPPRAQGTYPSGISTDNVPSLVFEL